MLYTHHKMTKTEREKEKRKLIMEFSVYVCLIFLLGKTCYALPSMHKSSLRTHKWEDLFMIDPNLNEDELLLDEVEVLLDELQDESNLDSGTWTNCGSSSDPVQILSIYINPSPPQKGQTFTVTAKVKLAKEISSGSVKILILYKKYFPIVKKTMKLCQLANYFGESCPLSAGTHTVSYTQTFPSYALSGRYIGKVKGSDSSGNELICVSMDMTIS